MSRRTIISDPGDEQAHLFAPATVEPKKCVRGCKHKHLCDHDANIAHGELTGKRPRSCLNSYDPATAKVPY